MSRPCTAIICAMATEVWPLVRRWRRVPATVMGRSYTFFEHENVVLLAGGIGYEPGHRAAEAIIAYAKPELMIAAGLAGALKPTIQRGQVFTPASVIDELTGAELRYA